MLRSRFHNFTRFDLNAHVKQIGISIKFLFSFHIPRMKLNLNKLFFILQLFPSFAASLLLLIAFFANLNQFLSFALLLQE